MSGKVRVTFDDIVKRFWSKVCKEDTNECWMWIGCVNGSGYGSFKTSYKSNMAHRFSWELVNGKIPNGLEILHKCDNRLCVNPNHMDIGTSKDNMRDMINKGRSGVGDKNSMSKYTELDVLRIKKAYKKGISTYESVGKLFGISWGHVRQLVLCTRWKHISYADYFEILPCYRQ